MKKRFSLLFILLLVLGITTGCLNDQEVASSSQESEKDTSKTYNWKMISSYPQGSIPFSNEESFVNLVNDLSDGRLTIKLHPVGELAPANQIFDTVSNGTVEMGADWPGLWSGTNTAFNLLGSSASGLSLLDYLIWINEAGGQEMYDEIYGEYNLAYYPFSVTALESGIRSNVPIKSLNDLKGLNIRFPGIIQQQLIQKFGANPVTIAPAEIYESLTRGVVDAVEYSTPSIDQSANLDEVTKYQAVPAFYNSAAIFGAMINKDAWNSLPEDLQDVIHQAAQINMYETMTRNVWNDTKATNEIAGKIEVNQLPQEDLDRVDQELTTILEDLAAENPDFAKVLNSQREYMKEIAQYREFSDRWGFGTNSYPYIK